MRLNIPRFNRYLVALTEQSEKIPNCPYTENITNWRHVNSLVSKDVEPYTIVAGNPIRVIRKRFDDELIDLLECFKWWDKSIEEINNLIPLLTNGDLEKVRAELKGRI